MQAMFDTTAGVLDFRTRLVMSDPAVVAFMFKLPWKDASKNRKVQPEDVEPLHETYEIDGQELFTDMLYKVSLSGYGPCLFQVIVADGSLFQGDGTKLGLLWQRINDFAAHVVPKHPECGGSGRLHLLLVVRNSPSYMRHGMFAMNLKGSDCFPALQEPPLVEMICV